MNAQRQGLPTQNAANRQIKRLNDYSGKVTFADLSAVYEAQRVVVLAATTHPAFVDFARGLARGWRELSAEALGEAG